MMRNTRHNPSLQSRRCPAGIEALERRDCPAVLGITGTTEAQESSGATFLTVSLSAAETKQVAVDYYLTGTAKTGRDYRLQSGSTLLATPTGTLTFRPGETSKTIRVGIVNDLEREPTETVGITLFKPTNATIGTAKSATVTIVDNDSYTAAIVGSARLAEDRIGEYELRLSSPATKTETFYVNTEGGIATPGVDFRPLSQLPLIFGPGESVKKFRIQTLADGIANEYDEFFFLRLTPMSAAFPKVDPFGITIPGIGPAPLPTVSVSDVTVTEGNSGVTAATFTISLSGRYGLPVTLNYASADATATVADKDYESVTGSVTIAPGDTTAVVTVNIVGDTAFEPDETFSLVVSAPVNATLAKATGVATIRNDDADPNNSFQIIVTFPDNSLTAAQKQVFQLAATRWSQIIIGDLPDVTYQGRTIDDLEITATSPYIDGPGQILGQAGPRQLRTTGTKLPYTGVMEFDSADVLRMQNDGTLQGVILHEMGHVLGIGTLWAFKSLIINENTSDPQYVGTNGLREYRLLAGTPAAAGVPVENTGGQGTAGGHWRDSVFETELMTGYAERPGVAMPISRMTVGSLEDLGYTVNYAAADPYGLRSLQTSQSATMAASGGRLLSIESATLSSVFAAYAQLVADSTSPPAKQRALTGSARS
ncbi:MAG: Calx-beta domain-containing protein [Pirellulales bacterium]